MGTPLPPVVDGDLCSSCWGAGKQFGDIATPATLKVQLTSILQGEFGTTAIETELLTTHYLVQTDFSCAFEVTANGFLWRLVFSNQFTNLLVERVSDGKRAFVDDFAGPCEIDLPNALNDPEGNIMYAGFANITFI